MHWNTHSEKKSTMESKIEQIVEKTEKLERLTTAVRLDQVMAKRKSMLAVNKMLSSQPYVPATSKAHSK